MHAQLVGNMTCSRCQIDGFRHFKIVECLNPVFKKTNPHACYPQQDIIQRASMTAHRLSPLILLLHIHLLCQVITSCSTEPVIVVLTHSRSSTLRKTLRSLKTKAFISVDANRHAHRVIRAAETEGFSDIWRHEAAKSELNVRQRISRHHFLALSEAFSLDSDVVILLEDDLIVSNDYIKFVNAHIPLLKSGGVQCISGWSDNSFGNVSNEEATLTTFFPGLGWAIDRSFWEKIQHLWPDDTHVGIGWDFWMRILFDSNEWKCVTPTRSRIRHIGHGANVNSATQADMYSRMAVGGDAKWDKTIDTSTFHNEIQRWITSGTMIHDLNDVTTIQGPVILGYTRQHFESLSRQLDLWPTARGHYLHTLWAYYKGTRLLLLDIHHAPVHWVDIPPSTRPDWTLHTAPVNTSCEAVCNSLQLHCDAEWLQLGNRCGALQNSFPCTQCGYETGRDLPAFVMATAPLSTRGTCLITEGLYLDCTGRHELTRRLCTCLSKNGDKSVHDEL